MVAEHKRSFPFILWALH